jgi:hypothetical protein
VCSCLDISLLSVESGSQCQASDLRLSQRNDTVVSLHKISDLFFTCFASYILRVSVLLSVPLQTDKLVSLLLPC